MTGQATSASTIHFEWHNDRAIAPDGTEYVLFSEHVRGERRFYWPCRRRGPSPVVMGPAAHLGKMIQPRGGDVWETVGAGHTDRRVVVRQAERHWRATQEP